MVLSVTGLSLRLAPDEYTYANRGWLISQQWSGDLAVDQTPSNQPMGYFWVNAAFFTVFDNTTLPLRIFNCFLGALACRYLYLLARGIHGPQVARRAAVLFQFFPSLVLWSTLNIRDVWVILIILIVSQKSFEMLATPSAATFLKLLVATYSLTLFRDYLFYVVAIPPIVAMIIGTRGNLGRNLFFALLAGLALVVLVEQGLISSGAQRHLSLEAMAKVRQDLAEGKSAIAGNVDISTPGGALSYLPIGLAYFFFSPFPWQMTSTLKLLTLPEMLLIYLLTPAIVRGIIYSVRYRLRASIQVLLLSGLLSVSYALGEGNVGTLYRHRAQALGFFLMLGVVGLPAERPEGMPAGEVAIA